MSYVPKDLDVLGDGSLLDHVSLIHPSAVFVQQHNTGNVPTSLIGVEMC